MIDSDRFKRRRRLIISSLIDVLDWDVAEQRILNWAEKRASKYICICNVHSVMTAKNDDQFREVINQADMATPDGMPLVWLLRTIGEKHQIRINGPDLFIRLCKKASIREIPVFLYGGAQDTLERLRDKLAIDLPTLKLAGVMSPPFRALSAEETQAHIDMINNSGAGILFVCLGCPKQETWMKAHRGEINAVMIGVGAAFAYHAGTLKRAPLWMQYYGLEWLYRLGAEPQRLWKRYLSTNTQFILLVGMQLLRLKAERKRRV